MDKDAYISFFSPTVLPINHCPVVSHSPQFLAFLFVIWCQLMTLLSPIDILHLWLLLYNYTVTFHENYSTFTTVAYLEQTEPWKQCLHISHSFFDHVTKIRTSLLERCERSMNESKLILAEILLDWLNHSLAKYLADCKFINNALEGLIKQTGPTESTTNP